MSHTRSMEEAYVWDAAAALAWAKRNRSWTTRRYRLEGSAAGNSRLVTQRVANEMFDLYGGTVVELIPATNPDIVVSVNTAKAEGMRKCPHCGSPKNKSCVNPQGAERPPHHRRSEPRKKKGRKS